VTRRVYDKLVRDLIPQIIREHGNTCEVDTLHDDMAFRRALRDKLGEEAPEAAEAPVEDLATELADLHEVIDTMVGAYGLSKRLCASFSSSGAPRAPASPDHRMRLLWTK
jgi:predicted house-cleaning noncanonical NTP pyrophosphatase (MazG superfamily)